MAGDSAYLRNLAQTLVKRFKRGGAFSGKELGNILVNTNLSSWLDGYEQAVTDFYAAEDFDAERSKRYWGKYHAYYNRFRDKRGRG